MSMRWQGGFIQYWFNPLSPPTSAYGLFSWGRNNAGQLGLGNITYYSSPKQVGALTTWSKIAGGSGSTIAIHS